MVNIQSLPLKIVFFTHLLLSTWASQGSWLPNAYLYYNGIFLVILMWSIHHRESDEPVFMGLFLNFISILLDIITISVFCPPYPSSFQQFSIAIAIVNLIMRPVSSIILFRIMNERSGEYNSFGIPNLGNYFGSGGSAPSSVHRGTYENIDQPVPPQCVPQNNFDPCSPQHKGPYTSSGVPITD